MVSAHPDVAKEMASVLIVEDLGVIFLDLFHLRMIRCDASPDQSKGMRVSIVYVYAYIRHIFDDLLRAVEPSGTAADDSKAVLLIRLDFVLIFDLLLEFIVVVLCVIEPEGAERGLLED